MARTGERGRTFSERLDWRPGRWTLLAFIMVAIALSRPSDTLAGDGVGAAAQVVRSADVTDTTLGRQLRARAGVRLRALGMATGRRRLRVLRDRDGYLIVPRTADVARRANGAWPAGAFELVPVVRAGVARGRVHGIAVAAPAWVFAGGGCYERISDGWSWLDHCAGIYRLTQDGDPQRDFYALQRYGTAGSNVPWVLNGAELGSEPVESSPPMTWQDWNPRSDRSGPCQTITVRLTTPLAGLNQTVDRCETWDITKGAAGGDFSLTWSGCACVQDRALAYVLATSVSQGALPAWYVPAQVHGFAF